jgi:hypothetical protein
MRFFTSPLACSATFHWLNARQISYFRPQSMFKASWKTFQAKAEQKEKTPSFLSLA